MKGEGFSFFIVRKLESTGSAPRRKKKRGTNKRVPSFAKEQLGNTDHPLYIDDDRILTYSDEEVVDTLSEHLRMIKRGTWLGTLKKNRVVPSHELAMATHIDHAHWRSFELTYDEAIAYLQKGTVQLPPADKGFCLVSYRGVPMGWVNHLGFRVNNLYPTEYRVLKQKAAFRDPEIV